MPWKECSVMDERLRFVARLLDGEAMSEVCRAFGISRKTGYKIFERYKEHGLEALTDRSRRPVRYANQLPEPIESLIVAAKREKPHWGARKIRERLVRRLDGDIRVPAKSTIHAALHRHGLVKVPGRPRHRATGTPLSTGAAPNDLWHRQLSSLPACGSAPGWVVEWHDDTCSRSLYRLSVPLRDHQPRRLAVFPVPARAANGRGVAGRSWHHC